MIKTFFLFLFDCDSITQMVPDEEDYRSNSSELSDDDYEESDEEQEDPSDYCKGFSIMNFLLFIHLFNYFLFVCKLVFFATEH